MEIGLEHSPTPTITLTSRIYLSKGFQYELFETIRKEHGSERLPMPTVKITSRVYSSGGLQISTTRYPRKQPIRHPAMMFMGMKYLQIEVA